MRNVLATTVSLLLAMAVSGGAGPESKPVPESVPPPDPAVMRQGGDTIADAVPIAVWYEGSGSTVGYTDDYDEVCPYPGSTSPDVVYALTIEDSGQAVAIDMFGSQYDTKIYLYDSDLGLVACNDDFYADYTSRIELPSGLAGLFYLVVDGYGGDAGTYQLTIDVALHPVVECPPSGFPEDEPELVDEYVDAYNGGCDALDQVGEVRVQAVGGPYFCGTSGWFLRQGQVVTDSDWLSVVLPASGVLSIDIEAEWRTTVAQLGSLDCEDPDVVQSVVVPPAMPANLTITGEPLVTSWLRIIPTAPDQSVQDYDYLLIMPDVIATRPASWSAIKGLF